MARKKHSKQTVFAFNGEIRYYENKLGVLRLQVSDEEWDIIVKSTVEYCAYVEALKNVACPMLDEEWDTDDQVYLNELKKTIKQIKALDPFILAKYNYDDTVKNFTKTMTDRASELVAEIKEFSKLSDQIVNDSRKIKVSDF